MATLQKGKRCLYVGGLDNQVTEQTLYSAFVPFGPIKAVQIPLDYNSRTWRDVRISLAFASEPCAIINDALRCLLHVYGSAERGKGFGFVEYEEEGDAAAARDNMDGAFKTSASMRPTMESLRVVALWCR